MFKFTHPNAGWYPDTGLILYANGVSLFLLELYPMICYKYIEGIKSPFIFLSLFWGES